MRYGKSRLMEMPIDISKGNVLYATPSWFYSAKVEKRFCRFNLSNNNVEESDDLKIWNVVSEQKKTNTTFEKKGVHTPALDEWVNGQ